MRKRDYVPLSIRENSRIVTFLWERGPHWMLDYTKGTKLARWLP